MADDQEVIITACSILLNSSIGAAITISGNNKRNRKTWVNEYVAKRNKLGTFNKLLPELSDGPKYFHYLRMDVDLFKELYTLVEPVGSHRVGSVCTAFITFSLLDSTCSMLVTIFVLVLLAIFYKKEITS